MTPVANVSILIRAPARDVFNAFLDPDVLAKFWLSQASARLGAGKSAMWEFMVPGVVAETRVKEIDPDRRLVLAWQGDETAELSFEQRADGHTRIEISSKARGATLEEKIANVVESTQGYTLVVSNLKALLETGKTARLVEDKAVLIAEMMAKG